MRTLVITALLLAARAMPAASYPNVDIPWNNAALPGKRQLKNCAFQRVSSSSNCP